MKQMSEPRRSNERVVFLPQLLVKQKLTLMVNRFEVIEPGENRLVAFAEQKRLKLKEEVTFSRDAKKSRVLFSMKSRGVLDSTSRTDILDASGNAMASMQMKLTASIVRSTWHLQYGGRTAIGQERSLIRGLLRRFFDVALAYHFDFTDTETGETVLSVDRKRSLADLYAVEVYDPQLDYRVAASVAVALDIFENR
jgi:uncharacterized protein YxjI